MLQRACRAPAQQAARGLLANLRTSAWPNKGKADDKDDDSYELLPPGCSMIDPTYGEGELRDGVVYYDDPEGNAPKSKARAPPATPQNLAEAQRQLKQKGKGQPAPPDDEEPYVYLPPGSSMREPGYNSLSDPTDRQASKKVYYRDPTPGPRK